jgi:hypothetical protein
MQYNINVANGTGMEVRTNLNLAHQSLATNFFGATDPSLMSPVCAFPGSTWADTGNGLLKVRNADDSDWIVIGTIESDGTPKLNASVINNTPSGTISATNVQDAINELASESGLNLRKPSTAYAVGDIAYSALLPSWAYIECTVAGTTDSGDLPVPSSVVANATFTDGTVTWKIRKVGFDNEQELATKANRDLSNLTQTGQDSFLERDFTIIYPNGGTEANPATVALNSRYVENNPFDGYIVKCEAEILYNSQWGNTGYVYADSGGYGTVAKQLDNGSIVVQTGGMAVMAGISSQDGSPFGATGATVSTAPCRVKVWKIGKVASA